MTTPIHVGGSTLEIAIPGFTYADLYDPARLRELAELFYRSLAEADPALSQRFDQYRTTRGRGMSPVDISAILVDTAPHLSAFLGELFQVRDAQGRWKRVVENEAIVFIFKREFVVRRALKRMKSADGIDAATVLAAVDALIDVGYGDAFDSSDAERSLATLVIELMNLEKGLRGTIVPIEGPVADAETLLERVARAGAVSQALASRVPEPAGRDSAPEVVAALLALFDEWVALEHHRPSHRTRGWVSLSIPHTIDYNHLVEFEEAADLPHTAMQGPPEHYRHRKGFNLTDPRFDHRHCLDQVHYCIYCHDRDKDSCSKGLYDKDETVKRNPLGIKLEGCPLVEKISEMHLLKLRGDGLASLALIMIDNPMVPGTGHRICNDCMKSCIYQKQDPVNIPQIETGVLTEVLSYPYGFEVYALLTRWNPLNVAQPYALPYNGRKVLVVGLGPAGYTLSQFLINEGFGVVGIDGLKVEPLPKELVGDRTTPPQPIEDWRSIYEEMDDRILAGFGGVSEYGITARWDKNFLKVIYITLARRRLFKIYGGVRFGGTMTIDDAWKMGFDHVAIATGAGKPTLVKMKNNLARGVRKASDFLMALQLTGAGKPGALANLQLRLPAVVIGGGLTGIDTATEAMAYYPVLVQRVRDRVAVIKREIGEDAFLAALTSEEKEILGEYLAHAEIIRQENEAAAAEGRKPDYIKLVRSWGGVALVYRKTMLDSPAYRLNHEEIIKAFEEGIFFMEGLAPVEVVTDDYGAAREVIFEGQALDERGKWRGTGEMVTMPARSVYVAAGTSPNTIVDRENPQGLEYDEWKQFFAPFVREVVGHAVETAAS